ncbi:polysaccharide deacetylase family protein [uncultured Aquimarina sp.]|uniref:polysaccharide deacetylase family protein n=1 Tax=uncultured Aquimarina sp. TaxID=575652 RepID=UPI002625FBA3|nr:polysaccharide deacetylase family protein [uncultured Aquimarina sp.]
MKLKEEKENIFLFSIDLEDVRVRVDNGLTYRARVDALVEQYLLFLNKYNVKATFFTVGDIPKYYPNLVNTIVKEGHEIACHSNKHIPVTKQTKEKFREDVVRNLENLYSAGANNIIGYRAPIYSITQNTSWAFDVLEDLGFKYSSSVLPAKNPLFGWENFGEAPRKIRSDLWEIPVSLRKGSFFKTPYAGGTYFRILPFFLIKNSFRHHFKNNIAVTGYFHPYDIDLKQERFMHPEINNSWVYNQLMYFNRKNVLSRLDKIMDLYDSKIIPYKNYIDILNRNE